MLSAAEGFHQKILADISYGSDEQQKMDIYLPDNAGQAPVIFMVHGGAWMIGDKSNANVIVNKGKYWLSRGYVFISVNYRLLPKADVSQQEQDIAKALAYAQKDAPRWGGDPKKFIVMGHSAGAHLVALLSADPLIAFAQGAQPWKASVFLDSAALDLPFIMQHPHFSFYDDAFGKDPAYWENWSPIAHITKQAPPMLLVCFHPTSDFLYAGRKFSEKAGSFGVTTQITRQDLTHEEINETLGLHGDYTKTVDEFVIKQLVN